MAVSGERQHTADPGAQVRAAIEHVLADRHGDWRSSPVGSQALALNYDAPSTLHRFYRCSPILHGGSGWPNHRKPQKMKHGLIRARTSTGKSVLVRAYLSIIAHVRSLLLLLLLSEEAADCILRASVQNLLRARHFSQSALSDAACDSCHVWNDVRIRSGSLDGKRNAALAAT
jgi:hypothetical protein